MGYKGRYLAPKVPLGWKKKVLIALAIILALILVVVLAAAIYWNAMLNKINRVDNVTTAPLSQEEIDSVLNEFNNPDAVDNTEPTDALVTDESEMIGNDDTIINIMLIGQDSRSANSRGRSDTMILCTINTETKSITLTSFMRDMYVKLPDFDGRSWGYNRINANYFLGGREMLNLCMQLNFGITVDHFVEVDFGGFTELIELMGGVDIELTSAEANHLNRNHGWSLTAGMNHLDGEQALAYSRIRKLDSDFGRTNRQRNVLTSLFTAVKHMNPAEINELLNAALPLISTDMTNGEITDYALLLIPMLPELSIQTLRIPADGMYYNANKGTEEEPMYVLVPDLEKNRQLLRDTLSGAVVE